MRDYIENTLHNKAEISAYADTHKLPLYLKANYSLQIMEAAGVRCLLALPKERVNLATLRKQREQLKKLSGLECVLCFETENRYAQQKLLQEGIPFVMKGKQIYLPFLGAAITEQKKREIQKTERISFLTQRLALMAIYEGWARLSLSETAKKLNVSKMSVTRSFNELAGLDADMIAMRGKIRYFLFPGRKAFWQRMAPMLRNPVCKQYLLDEDAVGIHTLGGMSAVCSYTLLSDNPYPTYALTREEAKRLRIHEFALVPDGEIPSAVIQVLGYHIPFADGTAIDPLSAMLSLTPEVKAEPRVEAALDQIVEAYVHD